MKILEKTICVLIVAAFVAASMVFPANADETTSDGRFTYTDGGETITITKYLGSESDVVVPSEIDDKPVTAIDSYAFYNCGFSGIALPDSLRTIGTYAFDSCKSLTEITIPDGVTSVGAYAFVRCTALESVSIPEGITSIEGRTFLSCGALGSVVLPNSVTSIGAYAFSECSSLESVYIPKSVSSIGNNVFKSSGAVTVFGVPGSTAAGLASATITFVPVPDFSGRQLALGSDLTMILYATYSDGGDTLTGEFGVGNVSKTITASKVGGEYAFRFEGIIPQRMGDTITATISVDGLPTVTYKTSVRDYLLDVAKEHFGDAALLTLIADLLEYGAAAQKYTDGSLDDSELVNYGTTLTPSAFSAPPPSVKLKTVVDTEDGFDLTAVGLRFENVNKLFVKFTAGDGFRITVNGDDLTERAALSGGVYTVYTDGVPASEFGMTYTFALYKGPTLLQTLTYSVDSMVAAKCGSADAATAALARATYNYGVSAAAYVASLS